MEEKAKKVSRKQLVIAIGAAIFCVLIAWFVISFDSIIKAFFPYDAGKEFQKELALVKNDPNRIEIPSAGIAAKLSYPKEVDDVDRALKGSVAHLPGMALPGEDGNIVYTAHSSALFVGRYASVFAPLNHAKKGATIHVYRDNKKFVYKVTGNRVISLNEYRTLLKNDKVNELNLVTCWPVGTDWKRLVVTARPVD